MCVRVWRQLLQTRDLEPLQTQQQSCGISSGLDRVEKTHILWAHVAASHTQCPGVSQMTPGGFGIPRPHGSHKELGKISL